MRTLLKNAKHNRSLRRKGILLVYEQVNQKVFWKSFPLNDRQKEMAREAKLPITPETLNTMTERDLLKIVKRN